MTARPMIIAHRGASGYRPEHTKSAYKLAFELGADAIEPDIVPTKDGVLVVRHESEISATTNVAELPEFADRRTTKEFLGHTLTGWFTEDFTWEELGTLRARERLRSIRPASAVFDDRYPIMRLSELFSLVAKANERSRRPLRMVAELKHATYFETIGLPLDDLFMRELDAAGWARDDPRLVVESFELTVLARLRAHGVSSKLIFLLEASGTPPDQLLTEQPTAAAAAAAAGYSHYLTAARLYGLAEDIDGISVNKSLLLTPDATDDANTTRGADRAGTRSGTSRVRAFEASSSHSSVLRASELVDAAHAAWLDIYCWTLRPENVFLDESFRGDGDPAHFGDWPSEFAAIMNTGVDGVFADHPDLALTVRNGL